MHVVTGSIVAFCLAPYRLSGFLLPVPALLFCRFSTDHGGGKRRFAMEQYRTPRPVGALSSFKVQGSKRMSDQRNQQKQQGGQRGQQGGGGRNPGQQQQANQKPGIAPEYEEQEDDQRDSSGSHGGTHKVPDPNTRGV